MDQPIKKLNLNRETVKTLGVKAGVRTGADYSLVAQGGASGRTSGGYTGSRGDSESMRGLSGSGGLSGTLVISGGLGNLGGH